jgi:phosphate transport system protein
VKTSYEERLEADLEDIRQYIRRTSRIVEDQVRDGVRALLDHDLDLANEVILGDRRVNRRVRRIDHRAHAFIVRYAPSAGHLRYVSSVLRLEVALERIGDYAGTIGRIVVQLRQPLPAQIARDIEMVNHQVSRTLGQALTAFHELDLDLARTTAGLADYTDATFEKIREDLVLVAEGGEGPLRDAFELMHVVQLLERVSDQAQNVCEHALFAITGETKDPKVFRILFVDEGNHLASPLAEAYCARAFPESGVFSSAGWSPREALAPALVDFLTERGYEIPEKRPSLLRPVHEEPRHYHIIVALHPEAKAYLGRIPFRSVLLEWDPGAEARSEEPSAEDLEKLYQVLSSEVQDLMHTLRGRDAR